MSKGKLSVGPRDSHESKRPRKQRRWWKCLVGLWVERPTASIIPPQWNPYGCFLWGIPGGGHFLPIQHWCPSAAGVLPKPGGPGHSLSTQPPLLPPQVFKVGGKRSKETWSCRLFTVPSAPTGKSPTTAQKILGTSQHGLQFCSNTSSLCLAPLPLPVPMAGSQPSPLFCIYPTPRPGQFHPLPEVTS